MSISLCIRNLNSISKIKKHLILQVKPYFKLDLSDISPTAKSRKINKKHRRSSFLNPFMNSHFEIWVLRYLAKSSLSFLFCFVSFGAQFHPTAGSILFHNVIIRWGTEGKSKIFYSIRAFYCLCTDLLWCFVYTFNLLLLRVH